MMSTVQVELQALDWLKRGEYSRLFWQVPKKHLAVARSYDKHLHRIFGLATTTNIPVVVVNLLVTVAQF